MATDERQSRSALVVEDAPEARELVSSILASEGFSVATAEDGATAVSHVREREPDLIVLDVALPGVDGLEVCRRIRQFSDAYVLMLSGRADEGDRVGGLLVGADDYMTKPFSPRELAARAAVLLRRPRRVDSVDHLRIGSLEIELGARRVRREGKEIALTRIEFDLLEALALADGRAVAREVLFAAVWGEDAEYDSHLLDVHASNLRRKIESDPRHPVRLRTVRGIGFRLDP